MRKTLGIILISIIFIGFGCSLDGGNESFLTCGIRFDEALLDSAPEDTAYIRITSGDLRFQRKFIGERRNPELGNPVQGNFTNLFIYESISGGANPLTALGTSIEDQSDSSNVTIAFNFDETASIDKVCRMNKTLQFSHEYSEWQRNKQGAEIRMTVKIDDEWISLSSNGQQDDTSEFELLGAKKLDEFDVHVRLQGNFATTLVQEFPASENPFKVDISGSFIINAQAGY